MIKTKIVAISNNVQTGTKDDTKKSVGTNDAVKSIKKSSGVKKTRNRPCKNPVVNGMKCCTKCDITKSVNLFRAEKNKLRADCIECEKEAGRNYRQSDVGKENAKQWSANNKERHAELQAEWYQENKPKINEKYNKRMEEDLVFRLKQITKSRIHVAFKNVGLTKTNHTIDMLHCNIDYYTEWMKYCIDVSNDKNMSIDDHGSYWHIDHVIPIAKFDLKKQINQDLCFGWFNTMPLEKEDNMAKKDKIDKVQIKKHIRNVKKFFEQYEGEHLECSTEALEYLDDYFNLCATYLVAGSS